MTPLVKALIAGVAVLVPAIGLVAVTAAQPPIRIGASLSQTGAYAAPAQNQLRGYRLCVKHANEKGGLLGRRLELVVEDDRSEPAAAVRIYEKLITQDRVHAVLGPYTSPIADAVAGVTEKHLYPPILTKVRSSAPDAFGAATRGLDAVAVTRQMKALEWQDGQKVIVWPEELARVKPRFPTPPWSERR